MSRESVWKWAPAALLLFGTAFTFGIDRQQAMPLRADLAETLPSEIRGYVATDVEVPAEEIEVAGVSDYLMRSFHPAGADVETTQYAFTVYVGYYEQQMQGKTIHSPKNCLPGSGWEALQSQLVAIDGPAGQVSVNRYLLQRGDQRALVLYWYQGRGRIEANEYVVKANLLRDAALTGRSEEALVRIVVPVVTNENDALALATDVASRIVGRVEAALPI